MSILLLPKYRTRYKPSKVKLASVLLCGFACFGTCNAFAVTAKPLPPAFNIQLQAEETWRYDSNPLRQVHNDVSISGFNSAVGVVVNKRTPNSKFTSSSKLDRDLFDDNRFNTTNFHQKADLSTKTKRWTAGVSGTLDYDTTRTSEITNFTVTVPRVRHLGWSVAPEIGFTPTVGNKFNLASSYSKSVYDNSAFIDYDFYQLRPSYSRHFDELNTGVITLIAQRFEAQNNSNNTIDSIGPTLGWNRILTPEVTARVNVGAQHSKQDSPQANVKDTSRINYIYSGTLNFTEEQDQASLMASREQQPFGNGSAALFTTFRITESHSINENLSLNGGASYRYAEYLVDAGVNLDRDASANAGLAYKVLNNVDITTNYQYSNQTLTNTKGAIKQHVLMVGLAFHPFEKALY